jgi:hypothetical protein
MERLVLLKQMLDAEFISEEEFNHRKTQLINELTNTVASETTTTTTIPTTTTTVQTNNLICGSTLFPMHDIIPTNSILDDNDAVMIDGFIEEDLNIDTPNLIQLPLQTDNLFTMNDSTQISTSGKDHQDMFSSGMLSKLPDEDLLLFEDDMRILSLEQKQDIINTMVRLSHSSQLKILQLLQSKTPEQITEYGKENEYICDLSQVDEETCVILYDTVKELEALEMFEQQKIESEKEQERSAALKRKLIEEDESAMESTDEEDNHPVKKKKKYDPISATVLASPIDLRQIDWFGLSGGEFSSDGKDGGKVQQNDGKSKKFTITVEVIRIQKKDDGSIKPYECDVCHSSFKDRSNLVKHIRVHTKERPFECTICGNRYAHSQTLRDHMFTHQTNGASDQSKPFKCTEEGCSKSFANEANMKRHMRTHTKEQPYNCHVCNKSFSQSGNLKTHLKLVHKVTPVGKVTKNNSSSTQHQNGNVLPQ